MGPLCRVLRAIGFCGLVLASLRGAGLAQEDFVSRRFEYYLDEQTELTLDSRPEGAKSWTMELRQYGEPPLAQIYALSGELKQISKDVFEYRGGPASNPGVFRVVGKPGDKTPLEITTRNLFYEDTRPVHIHGTFKPVDPAYREARMKERFRKADAALTGFVARLTAELGKESLAKLLELQADRIKLRDTRAAAELGDPEAPVRGLGYWSSLFTSTIENIAFLKAFSGVTVAKGFGGSFRAGNGASLDLQPTDETLQFSIAVPPSDPGLTGQMTGVARLFGTRALFKEVLKKEVAEAREPAELIFTLRGGHIVHVEAKNTDAVTGAGASFEGDYYKVAPLAPHK